MSGEAEKRDHDMAERHPARRRKRKRKKEDVKHHAGLTDVRDDDKTGSS